MSSKSNTELNLKWKSLEGRLFKRFNKVPGLESILFLIGLGEYSGSKEAFSKEDKQNLIHIGLCAVLTYSGYYSFTHTDDEGWPHYESRSHMSFMELKEQEDLIKQHVLNYFERNGFL